MPDQPEISKFQQRLAERRAREEAAEREAAQKALAPAGEFDADLIPESTHIRSEEDREMDDVINRIDILSAYIKWCGKMVPDISNSRTEGIKISCPVPGHADKNPSAWINTEKQVWFCGGCQAGGDKYDLAAFSHGVAAGAGDDSYKEGAEFHKLRELMATDYGYTISKTPGGSRIIIPPVEEPEERPEPPTAEVVNLHEDLDEEIEMPSLDWRPVVPADTFLDKYMKATIVDDAPEEYHFFHGLIALGFALGRDVSLFDSVPVYGNLFICTLGRSGTGKSKAKRHLDKLLDSALPYDPNNIPSTGTLRVSTPGSAETLVYNFMAKVMDPTDPKKVAYYAPVRGLIDFNELSQLTGRSSRQGSVLKPTLMQFYDMESTVSTSSMTTGLKIAKEPFASAITTSQPKALRELITGADDSSGFLNRWLFVPGKEKRRFSVGGTEVDTRSAVKPLQEVQAWARTFGNEKIEWSETAYMRYDAWFHNVLEPLRKKASNDLLVRVDLTIKKLCLLFAANRHEKVLSEQSVLDALHCFPYIKASYGIPEAQIGNTLNNEISELVMYQVQKYKGNLTAAKLWDNIKHRKYDRKRVLDALTTLVKMGLVNEVKVNTGKVGRPTVRYESAS